MFYLFLFNKRFIIYKIVFIRYFKVYEVEKMNKVFYVVWKSLERGIFVIL